jgi:acyl-CoA synthetase (NDP forming)
MTDPTLRSGSQFRGRNPGTASQNGKARVVPEHEVKAMLARHGVTVPEGTTDLAAVGGLREPLVVKAYGDGLVHKSELGAVELHVTHDTVDAVAARLLALPGARGVLVEEQARPFLELLVGVVNGSFGPMLAVGMGGTQTELLDDVVLRALPVDRDDVRAMTDELRSARLLHGYRGAPAADLDAIIDVVLGICALAGELGDQLAELECNPVIAGPTSAVAVDARLILREQHDAPHVPNTDFAALFAPRGIAVAGASTTKQTFGNRFIEAYAAMGWHEHLAAVHPSATLIDGVPAYPSLHDVPHPVDYVIAAVPAAACADLVRDAAGVARFVQVISGGFSEIVSEIDSEVDSQSGRDLERALLDVARNSGVRVLGPNCMGVFCPAGRQTFQLDVPRAAGPVSVVSQSGGLAGDIVKAGAARGIEFSKLVTVGNAIDVTPGELCEWLVEDPDTGLLGLYLEDPRDGARLTRALDRARDLGKAAVVLVGGLSGQGGRAVASHTGSLAGDAKVWRAVSKRTNCSIVATLEEPLGALAYLQRYQAMPPAESAATIVVGMGGGASVLTTDACDRAGLQLDAVDDRARTVLRDMGYGAGTSVANPIEIPFGPAAPIDAFYRVLQPILDVQPYRDVLVHVNVQAFFSYAADGGEKLVGLADAIAGLRFPGVRVALVIRNLEVAPPALAGELLDRCRELGVQAFRTAAEAAVAIAAAQRADITAVRPASPTAMSS